MDVNLMEIENKMRQIIRLRCRSYRIGSYRSNPIDENMFMPLYVTLESITFHVPPLNDYEKILMITFTIHSMTDEQFNFIRYCFPGDKVKEIDQKEANEMLLKSTPIPFQNILIQRRLCAENKQAPVLQPQPSKCAAKVNSSLLLVAPDVTMLKYPPPPQTGGVAISFADFLLLGWRRPVNDAIIEFSLKYFFNERLTPLQQEQTQIFNSFFFSGLFRELKRIRPVQDATRDMQVRCHGQFKNWTRQMDIFSKDFIFVPVNHCFHWTLVVICFPGKVPEVSESASKPEAKNYKPPENASTNHEQESSSESKVIRELSNNAEGDNLNQDENSANSVNSIYLVKESGISDKQSSECTSIPEEGPRREMPCICIFDSYFEKDFIAEPLWWYLEMEWESKKGTKKVFNRNTMPYFLMKCPKQKNVKEDCGLFFLEFVENFFKNPIPYFGNPMPDLTDWFSASKIYEKQRELIELIFSIHTSQVESANAGRVRPPPEAAQGNPNAVPQNDNNDEIMVLN